MEKKQKTDVSVDQQRDIEILNLNAEELNREGRDTLDYQVPMEELLEKLPSN